MAKIIKKEKKQVHKNIIIKYITHYFKVLPLLVLLIILIAGFSLIIKPKYYSIIEEVEKENEERQLSYEKDKKYLDDLILLQRAYDKISVNDIDRLDKMLPDKPEIENIMVMLENIAGKQYIKFDSMNFNLEGDQKKPSPVTLGREGEQIKKINFNIEVSGVNYRGFKKLLTILENNLRLFDIDSVNFNPGDNSASLDITAYYWNI